MKLRYLNGRTQVIVDVPEDGKDYIFVFRKGGEKHFLVSPNYVYDLLKEDMEND